MNRFVEVFALTGLVAASWGVYARLAAGPSDTNGGVVDDLALVSRAVLPLGLQQRVDVTIEIDQNAVAKGFSRPGCDGLLLIAKLPRTAQAWDRLAPRLDLNSFRLSYAYDGTFHDRVPTFKRFVDTLRADLPLTLAAAQPRIFAVAEAGRCNLLADAEAILSRFSRGEHEVFRSIGI